MYLKKCFNKVKHYIESNKKIDMYQCEVVIKSNGMVHSTWQFRYSEDYGMYPTRRRIIKTAGKYMNIHDYIRKHNLTNVNLVVLVWCKIGTFKKKQLSFMYDINQKVVTV